MSPKSRGRKTGKPSKSVRRSPGSQTREPGLREARDRLIDTFGSLVDPAKNSTAYEAEVLASVLSGRMGEAGVPAEAATNVTLDVIDELGRRDEDYCYPALRALAVIGAQEVREYAASAAERMVLAAGADGVFRPPWVDELGEVSVGTCRVTEDPFGEMIMVCCDFTYRGGSRPHLIWVVIDATWHGAATTLSIGDGGPDAVRKLAARDSKKTGGEVREVTPAEAGALLLPALDALERHGSPHDDDDHSRTLGAIAITRQRAEILLGPGGKAPAAGDLEDEWTSEDRKALADEFLASPYARNLPDHPAVRTMPLMLISICLQLGRDPRLVGPHLLRTLVRDAIPVLALGPDRFGGLVPDVVRAWTSWLAERRGLDKRLRKQLTRGLGRNLLVFRALWKDPRTQPLRRYVQDLPDEVACDGERQRAVLDRRTFAVPEPGKRPAGFVESGSGKRRATEDLDAALEADRVLVAAQTASSRGVPSRLFDAYIAVAEQLWTDEPPEAWAAAQRMREAGKSRDAILDRLARTLDQSGGPDGSVTDGYVAALGRLR